MIQRQGVVLYRLPCPGDVSIPAVTCLVFINFPVVPTFNSDIVLRHLFNHLLCVNERARDLLPLVFDISHHPLASRHGGII